MKKLLMWLAVAGAGVCGAQQLEQGVPPIMLINNEPHLFQGVVVEVQFNPRELPSDIKRSKSK